MNLDQFSVVVDEDTRAINPQTSLGEQNAFIENLRNAQAQRNAEIQQQTHDLGTDVPSQLGGLTGGEGYFQNRLQTPYTNAAVGDLRATAQAQALSEAYDLELARANSRYNAAARAARERAARRNRYGGGGGGGNDPTTPATDNVKPDVENKEVPGRTGNVSFAKEGLSQNRQQREFQRILEEQNQRNKTRAVAAAPLAAAATLMLGAGPAIIGTIANAINKNQNNQKTNKGGGGSR